MLQILTKYVIRLAKNLNVCKMIGCEAQEGAD